MDRFERLNEQLSIARERAESDLIGAETMPLLLRAGQLLEEAALILDHCVKQPQDFPQHCDWISCCHSVRHRAHADARFLCDVAHETPIVKADRDDVCTSPPKGRLLRDPDDTRCHNPAHPGYEKQT